MAITVNPEHLFALIDAYAIAVADTRTAPPADRDLADAHALIARRLIANALHVAAPPVPTAADDLIRSLGREGGAR